MPFTPAERVSESDPAIRVIGHRTTSITLLDDANYDLGGYAEGTYEIEFTHPDVNVRVGPYVAQISTSPLPANYGNRAASSTDTANQTTPFISSVFYDDAGGAVENEVEFTTSVAHDLRIGDWVTVSFDADVALTTVLGGGTLADVDGARLVTAVVTATTFSIGPIAALTGSGDDADDAAMDANLHRDGHGDPRYEKVVRDISLFDGAAGVAPVAGATMALCEDTWNGEIVVSNPDNDSSVRFLVDGGAVAYAAQAADPVTPFADATAPDVATAADDWLTPGDITPFTNNSQGIGIDSDLLFLYNETGTTGLYTVKMKNSPVVGRDLDGFVCFFSRGNALRLRNRVGQTLTFSVRRVS